MSFSIWRCFEVDSWLVGDRYEDYVKTCNANSWAPLSFDGYEAFRQIMDMEAEDSCK